MTFNNRILMKSYKILWISIESWWNPLLWLFSFSFRSLFVLFLFSRTTSCDHARSQLLSPRETAHSGIRLPRWIGWSDDRVIGWSDWWSVLHSMIGLVYSLYTGMWLVESWWNPIETQKIWKNPIKNLRTFSKNIEKVMDFGHFWSKFDSRPLKTHLDMFLGTPGRFAIFLEPKNHLFRRVFRKIIDWGSSTGSLIRWSDP